MRRRKRVVELQDEDGRVLATGVETVIGGEWSHLLASGGLEEQPETRWHGTAGAADAEVARLRATVRELTRQIHEARQEVQGLRSIRREQDVELERVTCERDMYRARLRGESPERELARLHRHGPKRGGKG